MGSSLIRHHVLFKPVLLTNMSDNLVGINVSIHVLHHNRNKTPFNAASLQSDRLQRHLSRKPPLHGGIQRNM